MKKERKDNRNRNLQKGERQLDCGRYEYRYTGKDKKIHSVYSWKLVETDETPQGKKDGLSLREKEAEVQKQLASAVNFDVANRTTINDMYDAMMAVSLSRDTTKDVIERAYRNHLEDRFGDKKLTEIRRIDIKLLVRELVDKNMAKGTISNIVLVMSRIYNMAIDEELCDRNPASRIKIPSTKKRKVNALTVRQQKTLLESLKDRPNPLLYRFCTIAIGTGMRVSEILGLTWKDINFGEGTIAVNKSLIYHKRYMGNCHFFWTKPKTEKSDRVLPMTSTVQKIFAEMYREQTKQGFSSYTLDGETGLVFFTSRNTPYSAQTINEYLRMHVTKHNEEHFECALPHIHTHMFRHTFITRAIESGVPPKVISEMVGHSSVKTTLDIYTTVTEDETRKAAEKIDQYLMFCS